MINIEHYQISADILQNNTVFDDGTDFKISYEFNNKYFTVAMRYFIQDEILFGFIHFDEINGDLDKDSSYLVGYIIETYIYRMFDSQRHPCVLMFYTDKDVEDNYHHMPTFSFFNKWFWNLFETFETQKYKYYKVVSFNIKFKTVTNQYLIDYMDNQL